MAEVREVRTLDVGIGYTLASGRLFCPFSEFQGYAEELLGRPIWTHEFGDKATWAELREKFEQEAKFFVLSDESGTSGKEQG